VVINNLCIFRTSLDPAEAHPELRVDSNAVLTSKIIKQWLQNKTLVLRDMRNSLLKHHH
jgi:hypothetical protein